MKQLFLLLTIATLASCTKECIVSPIDRGAQIARSTATQYTVVIQQQENQPQQGMVYSTCTKDTAYIGGSILYLIEYVTDGKKDYIRYTVYFRYLSLKEAVRSYSDTQTVKGLTPIDGSFPNVLALKEIDQSFYSKDGHRIDLAIYMTVAQLKDGSIKATFNNSYSSCR